MAFITEPASLSQMASDVRKSISAPSKNMQSQTRSRALLGKHVANRVRNHCMVKTFVNGGSYVAADDDDEVDFDPQPC